MSGNGETYGVYLAQTIREEMPQAKALYAKTPNMTLAHAILARLTTRRDELEAVCIVAATLPNLQAIQHLPAGPANFSETVDRVRGVATFS